jgi:hypothetical protein
MVKSTVELQQIFSQNVPADKLGADQADRIIKSAIFDNGELRSFETSVLMSTLTAAEFIELLKSLKWKMEIGDKEGRICFPGMRYDGGFCYANNAYTCCPG